VWHAHAHQLRRWISKDTLVLGVSPQYQQIRNLLVPDGRFFDEEDDSAHIKCAVVSEPFAKERFGSDDAAWARRLRSSEFLHHHRRV